MEGIILQDRQGRVEHYHVIPLIYMNIIKITLSRHAHVLSMATWSLYRNVFNYNSEYHGHYANSDYLIEYITYYNVMSSYWRTILHHEKKSPCKNVVFIIRLQQHNQCQNQYTRRYWFLMKFTTWIRCAVSAMGEVLIYKECSKWIF